MDCQENVDVREHVADNFEEILDTLAKFNDMWNRRLDGVGIAKNYLKLTSLDE